MKVTTLLRELEPLTHDARMRRMASRPSTRGIETSSRMMSGWCSSTPRAAASPSLASPTTSRSGSCSSATRTMSRISVTSSHKKTRIARPQQHERTAKEIARHRMPLPALAALARDLLARDQPVALDGAVVL